MNNPETGPSPYGEPTPEQIAKLDQLLDAYSANLHDIEENGLNKMRIAQREMLERQLQELRAELPIRPETDQAYRDEVDKILFEADRQGRRKSVSAEEARREEGLTPDFFADAAAAIAAQEKPPTPEDATEEVLADIDEHTGELETDPLELGKKISALDRELLNVISEMEDAILAKGPDYRKTVESLTKGEINMLGMLRRIRGSHLNFADSITKAYPGSDLEIPESMTTINVNDLQDIVSTIRLTLGMLLRTRSEFFHEHPEQG